MPEKKCLPGRKRHTFFPIEMPPSGERQSLGQAAINTRLGQERPKGQACLGSRTT